MIHFNFVLSDIEAESLFECINKQITDCKMRQLLSGTTEAEARWFKKHEVYLADIKEKMSNQKL